MPLFNLKKNKMANKNKVEYCQQFDNCKGCPQADKDFCEGIKASLKAYKKKKRR